MTTSEVGRWERDGRAVRAIAGDLTAQETDAVVNAANERLAHGGGVAAALAKAGGPAVQAESDGWVADHGPVGPGEAAVTTAGDMPARMLVHVVGPRYRERQDNEGLLRQAVRAALDAAAERGATSVAMPAISAGIFGYPPEEAATVIGRASVGWLNEHAGPVSEIRLVGLDEESARLFSAALEE